MASIYVNYLADDYRVTKVIFVENNGFPQTARYKSPHIRCPPTSGASSIRTPPSDRLRSQASPRCARPPKPARPPGRFPLFPVSLPAIVASLLCGMVAGPSCRRNRRFAPLRIGRRTPCCRDAVVAPGWAGVLECERVASGAVALERGCGWGFSSVTASDVARSHSRVG